ncbi:hypothetical protein [Methanobrevibacter sp. UBA337]|jgi:hypothetical protein
MYTDDNCKKWDVRVVGDGKCVEYCKVDDKALIDGKDCNTCRKSGQKTLI